MRAWIFALLLLIGGFPVAAQNAADGVEVDIELFLAADVSRSMNPAELEIQRHGYAAALGSPEVMAAIRKGFLGRIAVTYVEWAGSGSQRVALPWTLIATPADAAAAAARIVASHDDSLRRTSISGALDYASADFDANGFFSWRRVIDVSGDGPNNQGRPVTEARDAAVAAGFIVNGLPLMTTDDFGSRWHIHDLDRYYEHCVIGGAGAFVLPVRTWEAFPDAVRRKIVLELAAAPHAPKRAQFLQLAPGPKADYDCLIGEKIWKRFQELWGEP